MEEYKYDRASIVELLAWAKQVMEDNSLPEGKFVLEQSTTINDCRRFVDASIATIREHMDTPTYFPYIKHLYRFRDKLAETTN